MGADPYCRKCYDAYGWENSCDHCDVCCPWKKEERERKERERERERKKEKEKKENGK